MVVLEHTLLPKTKISRDFTGVCYPQLPHIYHHARLYADIQPKLMDELQIEGVVLLGVAKGLSRKPGRERLFLAGRKQPLPAAPDSPALHYIQQIRDEAHRFAITGHRQRRAKASKRSRLQEIPGIGDMKRQALLKYLGGLQEVARAGVEDLAGVPGVSKRLAQRIYSYFHE